MNIANIKNITFGVVFSLLSALLFAHCSIFKSDAERFSTSLEFDFLSPDHFEAHLLEDIVTLTDSGGRATRDAQVGIAKALAVLDDDLSEAEEEKLLDCVNMPQRRTPECQDALRSLIGSLLDLIDPLTGEPLRSDVLFSAIADSSGSPGGGGSPVGSDSSTPGDGSGSADSDDSSDDDSSSSADSDDSSDDDSSSSADSDDSSDDDSSSSADSDDSSDDDSSSSADSDDSSDDDSSSSADSDDSSDDDSSSSADSDDSSDDDSSSSADSDSSSSDDGSSVAMPPPPLPILPPPPPDPIPPAPSVVEGSDAGPLPEVADEPLPPPPPSVTRDESGNTVTLGDTAAEREEVLQENFENVVENDIIGFVQNSPALGIPEGTVSDDTYSTPNLQADDAVSTLSGVETVLNSEGRIPAADPYQPPVYDVEKNIPSDPGFGDGDALIDSALRPLLVGDSIPAGVRGTPDNLTKTTLIEDSSGNLVSRRFDPRRIHLPLRSENTVNLQEPVPSFSAVPVTVCNYAVTGSGSKDDPYVVYNFQQFERLVRENVADYFQLGCDIDASPSRTYYGGSGFKPIRFFGGRFDGRGYRIANLYINRPDEDDVGLFAELLGARISNVFIDNASVVGHTAVGILAGHMNRSLVEGVYATGTVRGVGQVGGLVGFQSSYYHVIRDPIYYNQTITHDSPFGGSVDINIELLVPYAPAQIFNSHVNVLVNCVREPIPAGDSGDNERISHSACGGLVGWMPSGHIIGSTSKGMLVMSTALVSSDGRGVTIDGDMAGGIVGAIGMRESTIATICQRRYFR